MHGAGSALREPTAEAWTLQIQVIAEHVQQRRFGGGGDAMRLAVDNDCEGLGHHADLSARSGGDRAVLALQQRAGQPGWTEQVALDELMPRNAVHSRAPFPTESSGACRGCEPPARAYRIHNPFFKASS